MDTDVSLKDIRFLQAVRDINENPESHPETVNHNGEMPATKEVIKSATDLSRGEIKYRVDNGNRLLFDGLIEVHSTTFNEDRGQFDPKSVSLTAAGEEALSEVEVGERTTSNDGVEELRERIKELESGGVAAAGGMDADTVEDINERLNSLERSVTAIGEKVESLATTLDSLESSEWGGLAENKSEELNETVHKAAAMNYVFSEMFDIDIMEIAKRGEYPPAELTAKQQEAFESFASVVELDATAPTENSSSSAGESESSGSSIDDLRPSSRHDSSN